MDALIVNFKTPQLTEAAVRSVRKQSPRFKVVVYDSSDDYDGQADKVIKNEIDFDAFLAMFPDKRPSGNGWGSAKHCFTVDYCFRFFDEGFVLLDSDVLVKRDLSTLWRPDVAWVGTPHTTRKHKVNVPRLYPFCCFINTRMCREHGVSYFNPEFMWQMTEHPVQSWYDTGAWFLKATRDMPHEVVDIGEYIVHYGSGSFRADKEITPSKWLEFYSSLYK